MQGFLKFITGMSVEAIELRKKTVFKVVPMTNPDGVIAGNYRTSLSGNDLNRTFIAPNPRLHPTVCAIKKLVRDILAHAKEPEPIAAFIDIHGHSRKKSVFMYGPHYPLHNEKYLKSRVLPKLLDEKNPNVLLLLVQVPHREIEATSRKSRSFQGVWHYELLHLGSFLPWLYR